LAVTTIEAYEVELQRVKVLRSESLGGFVQTVREEIQGLWDRLLYGPRSTERFRAFYAGESTSADGRRTIEADLIPVRQNRSPRRYSPSTRRKLNG
jgi:hypothetical protein